ncbi:MAG: hypothetical protein DRH23_17570, partial [Deltaproteobacteria bacterium]
TDATEQANLSTPDPLHSSRVRPDGQKVSWDIISILNPALPFLRSPYAPLIPPAPDAPRHANGAQGIARLQLESSDPAALVELYAKLLGTTPPAGTQEHGAATVFRVGSGVLYIVERKPDSPAANPSRVESRPLRSVTLKAPPGTTARTLDVTPTHGANIRLVATDST